MAIFKDNFWTENGRQLLKPDLLCLRQDHTLYTTLLMQPLGKIECDLNGIRLADYELASSKFNNFINLAILENVDLAITPEYSCPWSSIDYFLSESKFPLDRKVWIIGCQSIKPTELKALHEKHHNTTWIYDESIISQNLNSEKFLDPVCLFFNTKDSLGQDKKVIIVQFKTNNFGGAESIWERDNFIPGNTFYILENAISSTKLLTLICSDSLQNLDIMHANNGYFINSPLLLVHIQLNAKPFNDTYKTYRNEIYHYGYHEDYNKEIICLNWARGVTYEEEDGSIKEFNKYGGSALYCKTNRLDLKDNRINSNHKKGLYYTNWLIKRTHINFFNYDEYLFLVENTKPSQLASAPSQGYRTGPKVIKAFQWNNSWEEIETVDGGFSKVCEEIENENGDLSCIKDNNNIIEVERIIQLSSGDIDFASDFKWFEIINLFSFRTDDTEISKRNTFAQEPNSESSNLRIRRINKYHNLKNSILKNPTQVPSHFLNAILKFDLISGSKNVYLLNLHSSTSDIKGTAIYLGERTFAEAKAFKSKVESLFKEGQQGKQVIVWYNNPELEKIYDEAHKPSIAENTGKQSNSFKKTKKT